MSRLCKVYSCANIAEDDSDYCPSLYHASPPDHFLRDEEFVHDMDDPENCQCFIDERNRTLHE